MVELGGYLAEAEVFGLGQVTTSSSADLAQATDIATKMVGLWGFDPSIGLRSQSADAEVGPRLADAIDACVTQLLDRAAADARALLRQNRDLLDAWRPPSLHMTPRSGDMADGDAGFSGDAVRAEVKRLRAARGA